MTNYTDKPLLSTLAVTLAHKMMSVSHITVLLLCTSCVKMNPKQFLVETVGGGTYSVGGLGQSGQCDHGQDNVTWLQIMLRSHPGHP